MQLAALHRCCSTQNLEQSNRSAGTVKHGMLLLLFRKKNVRFVLKCGYRGLRLVMIVGREDSVVVYKPIEPSVSSFTIQQHIGSQNYTITFILNIQRILLLCEI